MISFGRARTVSAAPFCTHEVRNVFRSKSERSGQPRPTRRRLPPFGQRDQAFALRQFPGSFARASDGFCLLAGFALGRFFVRLATLHLTKNALALHLLFEGPESLFDIVIANEYLQNVSNRGGTPEVSDSIKPGSNIGALRGSRKGFNSAT
jgi:hypothetical protein